MRFASGGSIAKTVRILSADLATINPNVRLSRSPHTRPSLTALTQRGLSKGSIQKAGILAAWQLISLTETTGLAALKIRSNIEITIASDNP